MSKYIPNRLFGFAGDDSGFEVFFHLGAFHPGPELLDHPRCNQCPNDGCGLSSTPPPPILGELVIATCDENPSEATNRPRATSVSRITVPTQVAGIVDIYDPARGYGFVRGTDGVSYHLHQSEIADGRMPLTGGSVVFFAGMRNSRPRACHVRVCR